MEKEKEKERPALPTIPRFHSRPRALHSALPRLLAIIVFLAGSAGSSSRSSQLVGVLRQRSAVRTYSVGGVMWRRPLPNLSFFHKLRERLAGGLSRPALHRA